MVDFFLLLMLAGAGDELQGIKKGIMEMADGILITKADGENLKSATQAQADFTHALHLFQLPESGWRPKVLTSSALEKKGIDKTWNMINDFVQFAQTNKFLERNRQQQNLVWFQQSFKTALTAWVTQQPAIQKQQRLLENKIANNEIAPLQASKSLLKKIKQIG
jgi:LAO/AO transport system kinase